MKTIVLGAGAVGIATAWHLAKLGDEVTVVERQSAAALETSWGNGSVIHASEVEPWSQPGMPAKILRWMGKEDAPLLLRARQIPHLIGWGLAFARNCQPDRFRANCRSNLELALLSLRATQQIAEANDIAYDRATKGVLNTYRSETALEAAKRSMNYLTPFDLRYEAIDPARCVALEPALEDTADTLAGGLYFERDEVGDCNKFTQGLADACAHKGVLLRFNETVTSVEVAAGRAQGVLTEKGRIAADRVVVALASFTAPLLAPLGIRVPVRPVKGLSITFPRGDWRMAPSMPVIDDSKLFGLVPLGDRLRISGSAEITGYDLRPAEGRAMGVFENASFTFPQLREIVDLGKARIWAGLRPVTPTGTPLIGQTRIPGLWVNAGHGHLGWTLACGSGRVLADLMCGRTPEVAPPPGQNVVVAP